MTPALIVRDVEKTFNPGTITENYVLKAWRRRWQPT